MAESLTPAVDKTLDTMISLTRLGPLQRVLVAGDDNMELYLALRRRGFLRATTPALCRVPRAQHAIGFIAGESSRAGIESVLDQISQFLATNACLALLVGSRDNGLKIRAKLVKLGFRIEAGVRCSQGLVLCANRQGYAQVEKAA